MVSHPGLIFFLQMVSHPGQFPYCSWMVSHPGQFPIVDGWCPILVTAPELQEGWVQLLFTISLLADIPPLGATRLILVTAPELQEGWVQLLFTISLLADIPPLGAARLILVMAPKLQ